MRTSSSSNALKLLTYNKSSDKIGFECRNMLKEASAQKNPPMDTIFEKPKKFSRKLTLKGKISSMKEELKPMVVAHTETCIKTEGEHRPRKISLNLKRKMTQSFRNCLPHVSLRKTSDETTVEMLNSQEVQKSLEKQASCRDLRARREVHLAPSKGPKLNNVLNCINTDKQLLDHRQQFRVG